VEAERKQKQDTLEMKRVRHESDEKKAQYFINAAGALLGKLAASADTLPRLMRLFQMEHGQYQQGLPMYAYKAEALAAHLDREHRVMVLAGGTGIGKTVSVPQYVYDTMYAAGPTQANGRVAVLVPRKAIAIGMARYVAMLRGSELGGEVGYGVGDDRCWDKEESRLVFMTYGYFTAVTSEDPTFKDFKVLLTDEIHERGIHSDTLMAQLKQVVESRRDFRVVVMSATIDARRFADYFRGAPVVEVPGVNFPVTEYFDAEGLDGKPATEALDALVSKVTDIYENKVTSGNILVFLATLRQISEVIDKLKVALDYDKSVDILPLHARLSQRDQQRVTK
jgi:HrpA-like RNA helicase